jgi:hypothetical protein
LNLLTSTYDRFPYIRVTENDAECSVGWQDIGRTLEACFVQASSTVAAVELYPGCNMNEISSCLRGLLNPDSILHSEDALLSPRELEEKFGETPGSDPVFAFMHPWQLENFFCPIKLNRMREGEAFERAGARHWDRSIAGHATSQFPNLCRSCALGGPAAAKGA